jgi:tetratricopeptide (TPR) repeat protein
VNDPVVELIKKGLIEQDSGNIANAIEIFSEIIRNYPDDPRGWLQRGHAYALNKQYQQAINDYEQVYNLLLSILCFVAF